MEFFKTMKNVLVTGGTGFLGSNICKYLTQAGYKVTVFDSMIGWQEAGIPEFFLITLF